MNEKEAIVKLGYIKNQYHILLDFDDYDEAIDLAIKALEENKALRLLLNWAVECGFGYDNFPEEYEKYKEDISDMDYIEGMIYIAKQEADNETN